MSSIDSQLAEINRSNSDIRTAQLNTNELCMNEQHQLGEQHQQHYPQPAMYEEDNDIEQREGLLRSLEQNPHMLRDFYQFIEFTRARSVQPSIQQICYGQRQIFHHNSSTPKCGRPLNDSGGSISPARKQYKSSKGIHMQMEDCNS
ncbi:unnamed protein product [Rotaria socialis]|uniref:Uncharacterized protein n=1 Tax=Rotaria socialis TaxID=392032 RepID=A0A821MZA9_9BILA|nr:unnamed protein product [Rotaria socialis]CAF4478224.1 unnamed protein product [Rotaria socialis]CAF4560472.1 unnamed protein product [Rotaria socialis]CAF4777167.1 unnamed protein product [Rotaria socialis]